MSKKILANLHEEDQEIIKSFIISPMEFGYLNDLDTTQNNMNYYINSLKTTYLKQVSLRLGYSWDRDLQFEIDLKDKKRELTITELPKKPSES